MANQKNTSLFPTVLKEYMPANESQSTQVTGWRDGDVDSHDNVDSRTARASNRGSAKRASSAGRLSTQPSPSRRLSLIHSEKSKLREIEKFEKNYRVWQQAKRETKQEQYKHYKEKIALQRELIRAQDELASQRREQEQQQFNQQRDAKKADRQARDEALQKICRQSLEDDRRRTQEQRMSTHRTPDIGPSPPGGHHVTSLAKPIITAGNDPSQTSNTKLYTGESPGKSSRTPLFRTRCLTPFVTEDDEGASDDEALTSQGQGHQASLPWHHAQLYRLYGNKADYFLHPKIEPKPKKHVHPKLKRQGGRAGADILWETLRNESRTRLHRDDKNVSAELKSAYSAFVRQSLTKNKLPVERNYCAEEDVPDMARLMDHSRLQEARAFRHKLEIMHRSSQTNEDRTRIHIFNNPIPDLNNLNGEDSIARYLPSWLEEDESEGPEYKKWLSIMQSQGEGGGGDCESGMVTSSQVVLDSRSALGPTQEDILAKRTPKPVVPDYPRLKFMTEKSSQAQGDFSHKFKETRMMKDIPKPYEDGSGDMAHYSHFYGDCDDVGIENTKGEKKRSSRIESNLAYTTPWQPLSMSALMEYQDKMSAKGRGDFNHGRTNMWQTTTVAS